jgi:methanogenic corrinoid protein MtbC1
MLLRGDKQLPLDFRLYKDHTEIQDPLRREKIREHGDVHDIGKNLVGYMLECNGFKVIDLGTDVAPDQFVQVVKTNSAQVVAISALLTTTMLAMPR